jgi:hypothetical protein
MQTERKEKATKQNIGASLRVTTPVDACGSRLCAFLKHVTGTCDLFICNPHCRHSPWQWNTRDETINERQLPCEIPARAKYADIHARPHAWGFFFFFIYIVGTRSAWTRGARERRGGPLSCRCKACTGVWLRDSALHGVKSCLPCWLLRNLSAPLRFPRSFLAEQESGAPCIPVVRSVRGAWSLGRQNRVHHLINDDNEWLSTFFPRRNVIVQLHSLLSLARRSGFTLWP